MEILIADEVTVPPRTVAAGQSRAFIEWLEEEKRSLSDDIRMSMPE